MRHAPDGKGTWALFVGFLGSSNANISVHKHIRDYFHEKTHPEKDYKQCVSRQFI